MDDADQRGVGELWTGHAFNSRVANKAQSGRTRLRVPDLQRTVFGPGGPTDMHNLGLMWPDADALGELLQSFACSADPKQGWVMRSQGFVEARKEHKKQGHDEVERRNLRFNSSASN